MTQSNSSNSSNSSKSRASPLIVYVSSHGDLPNASTTTFVPDRIRVVFYARDGENLLTLLGGRILAVLHKEGQESHTGKPDGSITVPNYELTGFQDLAIAAQVQLAALEAEHAGKSTRLFFVGGNHLDSPIMLCANPGQGGCRPAQHRCEGLFGVLGNFSEIRLLCCRAAEGQRRKDTTTLVNDRQPNAVATIQALSDVFCTMIESAPDSGKVTQDPGRLDKADQFYQQLWNDDDRAALLLDSKLVEVWFEIQAARRFRAEQGDWGLVVYFLANPPAAQGAILENSDLKAVLHKCRSRVKALVRQGPTPANIVWFHGGDPDDPLDDRDRNWLTVYAGPRYIADARRTAGIDAAVDAGWALSAYIRLRSGANSYIAVGRLFDPDLIAITTKAEAILSNWYDPNSLDSDLEDEWNALPDEERYALQALAPAAVASWQQRIEGSS